MSTTTTANTSVESVAARILREGYGPGAWHGADLKAALADVTADMAFRRPATGFHNIAEIAMHHAFWARSIRAKLTGAEVEPFILDGEDWFDLPDASVVPWAKVLEVVELQQERLARTIDDIQAGRVTSPLSDAERLDFVLGITCHAVYHAGQIQLVKKLHD